jgi:multidrug efflux pump subunit AcrA (membrane-fusion protein)
MTFSKNKIIFLIIAVLLIVLVVLISWGSRIEKDKNVISSKGLSVTDEAKEQVGSEGEVLVLDESTGEEVPLKTAIMPIDVFNTSGVIREVLNNGIIVYADSGESFADGESREISIIFNELTITTSPDRQVRWVGTSGLYQLLPGMRIVVESDENIRGKLKYEARYINIQS